MFTGEGNEPQRIQMRRGISYFTANHPQSSPFSKQVGITRSCSDSRLNYDYKEIVREKERDRPISHKWKYYKYHQFDNDYWFDQHSETPKFFPTYTRARYYFSAPSYDYFFYYPAKTIFPKFNRWSWADTMDVQYWRQYRDPYYDQPLWFPDKPWTYETADARKAVQMYKQKLVPYEQMTRYWLNPYEKENKQGYTSYMQRPFFWPNYPLRRSHFYDTSVI